MSIPELLPSITTYPYDTSVKILLFGPRGYLGTHFRSLYPDAALSDADIGDLVAVRAALDEVTPDVVINCAGRTGRPNVDWCETHVEETIWANTTGPLVLLHACMERGIFLLHLSSGCVYEGDNGGRGFTEADEPNFRGSVYSRSKADADRVLQEFPVLILRLRMPFEGSLHPRGLIGKLSTYKKVLDMQNSMTYVPDLLTAADTLLQAKQTGIFHITNPGTISLAEIARRYKEKIDPAFDFTPVTYENLMASVLKAPRSNCVLSTEKIEAHGVQLRSISDAVDEALKIISNDKKRL